MSQTNPFQAYNFVSGVHALLFVCMHVHANHPIIMYTPSVIVRCPSLTGPANGRVNISIGAHGVTLGLGAMATYTCNTGYGLVGVATRTCVSSGSTSGTWSGSIPTCECKLLLTCLLCIIMIILCTSAT